MEKHFQSRDTARSLSIIWGSQVKIQGISQRGQIARGRSLSESLRALGMNSSNESHTIEQTSSDSVETLTTIDNDNSPYLVNMDIVRKDYA